MSGKWAMSADLSGPHPVSIGTKYTYLMVAVVTTDEPGQNLPFVLGLSSKRGDEVAVALEHIIAEVQSITENPNILTRFHTDAGGEFINKRVQEMLKGKGIFQTSTEGYDPKSNSLAFWRCFL